MTYALELQLIEMGVIPSNTFDELDNSLKMPMMKEHKNYFNDPRDENGEVPY